MAFDFKKEYRDLYAPGKKPVRITVPEANFVAVDGIGDPNEEGGAYKQALEVLYAVSYTLRMSPKSGWEIAGYFEYVVPPLEGLWRQKGHADMFDPARKSDLEFTSMIRLPDFVMPEILEKAKADAAEKKNLDTSKARFFTYDEGLCIQCLHVGPYDTEPETMAKMQEAERTLELVPDYAGGRRHHEIYLSDPRRVAPEKMKTILRTPVKEAE